mgnify:CR=1 FL=1
MKMHLVGSFRRVNGYVHLLTGSPARARELREEGERNPARLWDAEYWAWDFDGHLGHHHPTRDLSAAEWGAIREALMTLAWERCMRCGGWVPTIAANAAHPRLPKRLRYRGDCPDRQTPEGLCGAYEGWTEKRLRQYLRRNGVNRLGNPITARYGRNPGLEGNA